MKAWVYFEDFEVGQIREFGSYEVTREEILEFGHRYDPQPFHVDEGAASASPFGGLVASGWHTCSICMRMMVDQMLGDRSGSLGSPGVDGIQWLRPVRPGDVLRVRVEVLETRPSSSKPDRGSIRIRSTVLDQDGHIPMVMESRGIFRRRPEDGSATSR